MPETEYIKASELSKRLNVGPRSITRWTKNGRLPHIKLGGSTRYDWVMLQDLIKVNYPTVEEKEDE